MSHQPFEEWLFDQTKLSGEQKIELDEHLQSCSHCTNLERSWDDVLLHVERSPIVGPADGFTERWKMNLEARRDLQGRNKSWRFIFFLTLVAIVSLFVIANQIFLIGSPLDWFFLTLQRSIRNFVEFIKVFVALISWVQVVPMAIKVPMGIMVAWCFSLLSFAWLFTMNTIRKQGVFSK